MISDKFTKASIFPLVFSLIILCFLIGILKFPQITSTIILAILLLWIYKTLTLVILSLKHFTEIQINESYDWKKRYLSLEDIGKYKKDIREDIKELEEIFPKSITILRQFQIRLSNKSRLYSSYLTLKRDLELFNSLEIKGILKPSNVTNIVIIASYKESFETLSQQLESIKSQSYDLSHLYIVFAMEERDEMKDKLFKMINDSYKDVFQHLIMTTHTLIKDEKAGKASNCRSSIIEIIPILKNEQIREEECIITVTDADTIFSPNYFSCLTYNFCISKDRHTSLFHATTFFTYNYKDIHAFSRVMGTFNTLDTLKNLGNKYIHPQSTYSLSLTALLSIGLWDKEVMSEDEYIYIQMFLKYTDKFKLVPLMTEIFMTMPNANKYLSSIKTVYDQMQRWVYGAIILNQNTLGEFTTNRNLSVTDRVHTSFDRLERTILWPFYSLFLVFGITIIQLIRTSFTSDEFITFSHNLTIIITLVNFILISFISILDYYIRRHHDFSRLNITGEILNMRRWLYFPFISILLGFIPYLDANLRIALGKDLVYKTSKKATQKDKQMIK